VQFFDGAAERGGWVHRPLAAAKSPWLKGIEDEVKTLRAQRVRVLGFIGMGGEISALEKDRYLIEAANLGINGVIQKPINLISFANMLSESINRIPKMLKP